VLKPFKIIQGHENLYTCCIRIVLKIKLIWNYSMYGTVEPCRIHWAIHIIGPSAV